MNRKLNKLLRPGRGWYYLLMLLFCAGAFIFEKYLLFGLELAGTAAAWILHMTHQQRRDKLIRAYLRDAGNTAESEAGGASVFPAVLVRMGDNRIIWCNQNFLKLSGLNAVNMEQELEDVLPGIGVDWLICGRTECPRELSVGGRRYRVYGTLVREKNGPPEAGILYLTDLTGLYQVRDEYIRSRPVVSILLLDNYEELIRGLSESAISTLDARINEAVTLWAEEFHGLLRKLDNRRFLFIFEKWDLDRATENKFSVLEDVHKLQSPSGLPVSLSVGVGVDGSCFEESYDFASLGVEMALSRGGDQAVVKDRLDFHFYGGRNAEVDNSSKVRSRINANSMMELFSQSSHIFIMGHKNADLDCIGAAMGIACLCRKKGQKCRIVVDMEKNAASRLIEEIRSVPEYTDIFVSAQDALLQCDNRSTLVVVDTNRPDQVESPPLLEAISRVCVVDHHRRAADFIDPVVLALHETAASSASELAVEMIQCALDPADVLPIEAKSLLAGICLDTKFFNVRSSERTFEAAAMLRRLGADTTEVKLLLQNDLQDTLAKYEIIRQAEIYRDEIAIAAAAGAASRVLAAQAADELLNIHGITASFVMYQDDRRVIISARSIGGINVQMVMEELGGGGNAAVAGAQLQDVEIGSVLTQLRASIDKFVDNK